MPALVALLGAGVAAAFLLPTDLFNIADDYRVYSVRVARMYGTGSVGGNQFDMLELHGLASQSFFQGSGDVENLISSIHCSISR